MKIIPVICKVNKKELDASPYICSLDTYAFIKLNEILDSMDLCQKDVFQIEIVEKETGPGTGFIKLHAYAMMGDSDYKKYLKGLEE